MKLSEALREFDLSLVGNAAPSTRRWYQQRLGALAEFLGDVGVEEVTITRLREWRAALVGREARWSEHPTRPEVKGGLSSHTVRGYIRAVRAFGNWLEREGMVVSSPAARLRLPPVGQNPPKAVSPDDVLRMLEVADVRDRAIVCFLACTGCRVGGLCDLRLSDLELGHDPPRAMVREKGRGGKKSRLVFCGPQTVEALWAWLSVCSDQIAGDEDHVFLGQRGPLTEAGVYQVLRRLAKKAGIRGRFNPHAFRHAFARGALENGADLGTVSQLLGHSSVTVTNEFYGRWTQDELGRRHSEFGWFEKRVK
jgi:integrase/recombinase XerD